MKFIKDCSVYHLISIYRLFDSFFLFITCLVLLSMHVLLTAFRAPNDDFSPNTLQTVTDFVYLNIFDEVVVDVLEVCTCFNVSE